ncbi:MAG: hypothetical protein Q8L10_03245 [Candidatus Moranbacteria bacterium]|nr:hypothetical protein [Candidatus Moranbacteria bacterium]
MINLIKEGTFLYEEKVICNIRLYETDFLPGSADYEDVPEIRDDKYGKFYLLKFTGAGTPDIFNNARYYENLIRAESDIAKNFKHLKWKE